MTTAITARSQHDNNSNDHHRHAPPHRQDLGLDMHTDACDVTLNVCLGKTFSGAGLTFCGVRGADDSDERKFTHRHEHVKGRAVMHLGHQRHGADDIAGGERYNLIIWSKSSTWRLGREFYAKYNARPSDRGPPDPVRMRRPPHPLPGALISTLFCRCASPTRTTATTRTTRTTRRASGPRPSPADDPDAYSMTPTTMSRLEGPSSVAAPPERRSSAEAAPADAPRRRGMRRASTYAGRARAVAEG